VPPAVLPDVLPDVPPAERNLGTPTALVSATKEEGAPALSSASAAATQAPAADEEMLVPSSHSCHATVQKNVLHLRCARAKGDGPGVIDVGNTDPSVVGGKFEITENEIIWTVSQDDEKHNLFFFEDGAWELATRGSDQHREWMLDGSYKPGAEASLRHAMTCCLESGRPEACFGQSLQSEASACKSEKACGAFDACIQKRLQTRRTDACKAPSYKDCFLNGRSR
jgi:hypothetical protein